MRPLLAAATLAALAGCASPDPNLYRLDTVAGTPRSGGPATVLVRDVSLAKYLDRQHIVRSASGTLLDVRANDWWAAPLPGMVGRTLAADLDQRLPGTMVYSESGAIQPEGGSRVDVNIDRLDADPSGAVVLAAQVATTRPAGTRSVRLTVPPGGPDLRSEVAAMSAAVGELADVVATMLRQPDR